MILFLKIVAAFVAGMGGTGLFWGLVERKVHFPIGHGLPFSREHFARQYWFGILGYSVLLFGGAGAFVLL